MSQRKDLKKGPRTVPSSQKNYGDSTNKKTAPKKQISFQESLKSNKKNLMMEFDRIQKQSSKFQQNELDKMSSVVSNSVSSSQISEELMKSQVFNVKVKEEDYGYQLPKSYVIAMSGLQQVVNQKQKQVKNLKKQLDHNIDQNQQFLDEIQQLKEKDRKNEVKIIELESHVKLLKETTSQGQKNLFQSEQRRVQFQRQTAKEGNKKEQKINSQQLQIKQLKSQLEKLLNESISLKQENKKIADLHKIQKQLEAQKEKRIAAEKEIQVLKKQACILAEDKVRVEQICVRQPLVEMIAANSLQRQASVRKIQSSELQHLEKRHQTAQKASGSNMDAIISNVRHATNVKKQSQNIIRQRSMTTSKQKQSPQLVSQYRQLMRHQKQLIGLNYQLELLQKGMTGKPEGKAQFQRNYQKLRRECEQKQMIIRQLKMFLNDPVR